MRDVTILSQQNLGDLKLAAPTTTAALQLPSPYFIAASTREGDERRMLRAWKTLPEPRPLLVIAPRHQKRLPSVLSLLNDWSHSVRSRDAEPKPEDAIFVLDTLGELAGLYPHAQAAFIGGTFDERIGGHSPAEAFACGLPVARGPHTHANPEAWRAGVSFAAEEHLEDALSKVLQQETQAVDNEGIAMRYVAKLPKRTLPAARPARPLLGPLRPAWRFIGRRTKGWREAPQRINIPVISVGSLVAGGAGKTPTVAWLANQLDGAWVVSRGYGRPGRGRDTRTQAALGDELEMLRRRGFGVVSAPDRIEGAREAQKQGARLILLDDGFQHRRLHRDLDIVCIDARWPDGRGQIPVGWRREPWKGLKRADWLWVNHAHPEYRGLSLPNLPTVYARHRPTGWLHRGQHLPLQTVSGRRVAATGIARPEGFLSTLLRLGITITDWIVVADHAPLPPLPPGTLVTEKDAARMPEDADVLALQIDLEVEGAHPLLTAIRNLVSP